MLCSIKKISEEETKLVQFIGLGQTVKFQAKTKFLVDN